jgi:molecular chaperone GrpE
LFDRDAILRRFEARLDEALAGEDPPRGIPEEILSGVVTESGADLYGVQAALTALTQEVKLQGRAFKQLGEAVAPVAQIAPALPGLLEEARREARAAVLDELLDLRDRLARGSDAARESAATLGRGWLAARLMRRARETVAALQEGYDLTAARLDELLAGFNVREIECAGRAFDPTRMHVVATEEAAGAAEGTVLEVYRRGYEIDGEVYRAAQVKVAKGRQA